MSAVLAETYEARMLHCFNFVPEIRKDMRRIIVFGTALLLLSVTATAQTMVVSTLRNETGRSIKKEADTTRWTWKRGGLVNASLSQGSLSNWAAGGDNFSLALSSYVNYYFLYKKGRQSWDNNIDFNFGYVQTTSSGIRKNDDRVDYLSKYGKQLDTSKWYISTLFNFRSQFFDGYTYSGSTGDLASTFLSPAYVLLSAGLDYKPNSKLSMFMSPLTSRTTIVTNKYLSSKGLYGVDTGKNVVYQVGSFVTVNYYNTIAKNITYKGRVDLFSNYVSRPQNIDFFMTNLFSFKINKNFSATYSLDLIYDDDVRLFGPHNNSPGLQTKSLLGIGFLMPLKPVRKV